MLFLPCFNTSTSYLWGGQFHTGHDVLHFPNNVDNLKFGAYRYTVTYLGYPIVKIITN